MWPSLFGSLHDYSFWQLARDEWHILAVYYVLVVVFLAVTGRSLYRAVAHGTRRSRVSVALLLTALLTPGTISDFFLFAMPGPAVAGLGMAVLGLLFAAVSLHLSKLPALFMALIGDYGLALFIVFLVCYACVVSLHRVARRSVTPNQTLQPTADPRT